MTLRRLLCVDDEPDIRTLLDIGLSTVGGFELRLCGSGKEAVEAMETFAPDLIILDVLMPQMDGPQTMRALRGCQNGRNCPTIFLTATVQPDEISRLVALGAVTVITKPFDPMTLAEKIRDIERIFNFVS